MTHYWTRLRSRLRSAQVERSLASLRDFGSRLRRRRAANPTFLPSPLASLSRGRKSEESLLLGAGETATESVPHPLHPKTRNIGGLWGPRLRSHQRLDPRSSGWH